MVSHIQDLTIIIKMWCHTGLLNGLIFYYNDNALDIYPFN